MISMETLEPFALPGLTGSELNCVLCQTDCHSVSPLIACLPVAEDETRTGEQLGNIP